ncbi:MAG TPA: hybrid sensor histidine kinase/response regulator [Anaerolineales bacterium]|nr:hybrid sensor histidine kinase/response regulator [Anaerolineales bacterium]
MDEKARILIIDDEEVVLDSCTQIMDGSGYLIQTAPDGVTGLRVLEEFQPDLVFVDLKMPGMSGMEVLEKINALDSTIVTVVITGFATVGSAVDAMKKGAYDFLPKPFTPDEFRLITRRSLEKRTLIQETIALRREKEMMREQFASIVSHELKAPLGAVQQNLFALEFELTEILSDGQKGSLQRLKTRVADMLKLINSWLRVISVDINKLKESFSQISISLPIYKALENVESLAVRKDVEIVSSINESLSLIQGDDLSLSEAFVNIFGNAIKYSRDGSKVSLQVIEDEKEIVISIKDSGIGISEDDLPHIFDGFFRGKSNEKTEGYGIGLAVSKQIIEAHNGSIAVESESGKGSTFVVRLPAVESESDPEVNPEPVGMAKS